jgi:hypothetical protein
VKGLKLQEVSSYEGAGPIVDQDLLVAELPPGEDENEI